MHVRDWNLFLKGQWDNEIAVAQVSQEMAGHVGASSRNVHLHQVYARKAVEKHGLRPDHLPLIFEIVDYGMVLAEADRPRHLTFLHLDSIFVRPHGWYHVTIKRGGEDRRLFLSTFHRTDAEEVARKVRKHEVIRWALK